MANLVLAFAELLGGAVVLDAAIKGASVSDVVKGQATQKPIAGLSGSSSSSSSPSGGPTAGTANPFSKATGLTIGRTDQGVDASMQPGSPILAPFSGTITAINQNWYAGQPQLVLQGAPGTPFAGKFVYLAEQIAPSVSVGQAVNAGDQLATYASHGTGIEMGWAKNASGQTLAQATTGYVEGEATAAGNSFRSFLSAVGA